MSAPSIHWFRNDLRVEDNPALNAAARSGPVLCVYILDEAAAEPAALGGASRWWLHHSLESLAASLQALGGGLLLAQGDSVSVLEKLITQHGASSLHFNRVHEPHAKALEERVMGALQDRCEINRCESQLLTLPESISNAQGKPFQVFTPYYKHVLQRIGDSEPSSLSPAPDHAAFYQGASGENLSDWRLRPLAPDWAAGFEPCWQPGEGGAHRALDVFIDHHVSDYHEQRDIPGKKGTSRLSPHLHFGEVSPARIWHSVQFAAATSARDATGGQSYLRELVWREFSYYLLHYHPQMAKNPLRDRFADFPWQPDPDLLSRWQKGTTGYPLVDAGMRELWHTGWMHNRVRMITASFLVKHLLVPWQQGLAWFHDTLVDADPANNAASWQWVAGCGADASPWFRIFNPVLQGQKFDPDGAYVRQWVPELADVPADKVHTPWLLPKQPANYPSPIVEHSAARQRALDAYASLKPAA